MEKKILKFREASIKFNNDERVRNLLTVLGKIHDEYASEFKEDYPHVIEQLESYDTFSIPDAFGIFVIKHNQSRFFEQENEESSDSFWEHVEERIMGTYRY